MFKITTPDGDFITEKVNYIRVHRNGVTFLLTDEKNAEGIAYHGTPYLFKDGTVVTEVDVGSEIETLLIKLANCKSQLAQTDEALIELYEMIGD